MSLLGNTKNKPKEKAASKAILLNHMNIIPESRLKWRQKQKGDLLSFDPQNGNLESKNKIYFPFVHIDKGAGTSILKP